LWTQDKLAAKKYRINKIECRAGNGLCETENVIFSGRNSGYQLINLMYHFGFKTIVLVGYDMQHDGKSVHWHGNHPKGFGNCESISRFREKFPFLASDLEKKGIKVLNCTKETALNCFKKSKLESVFNV